VWAWMDSKRRKASALSGGEKQRVALARALALAPRVLFLDEPTANVDAETRIEVENIIRRMSGSGTTVIMSTHNRELGYRLSDRLVRLEAGVPAEVDENVLKGRVERIDEQFAYFRAGEALLRCPARQGTFVVAVLPCDELILSPGRWPPAHGTSSWASSPRYSHSETSFVSPLTAGFP